MTFKEQLTAAFLRRKQVNASYSLRSLARSLRVDHATLSHLVNGRRRTTVRTVRAWGPKLGMSRTEITNTCLLENELAVLQALGRAKFRADSRWLAMTLNIPIDEVNVALQSLLRQRLLRMSSSSKWQSGEVDG